ncbi:MAG: vWA domain-containing protein, partial [Shewanella oncorhynchi]
EEREKEQPLSEKEKLGPMVICVDTSGSMQGMPETIAKAVTLFMSCKAKEQKRPCYLINFSTGLQYLDLGPGLSMESVIEFLSMSFYGGTDVAPALAHALEVMQKDDYRNADLLIISDFIMGSLPVKLQQRIEEARYFGNSFYSLVVGSAYMTERLTTLFDHEWVFNPKTSQIHELISFKNKLSRTKDSV